MKTIVSVTPLQVTADTRTFKIATSFARFGYRSIVVEGEKSELACSGLPFELRSPRIFSSAIAGMSQNGSEVQIGEKKKLQDRIRQWVKRLPEFLQKPLFCLAFPPWYLKSFVLGPASVLPNASLYYLHAPYQFPAVYWVSRREDTPIIYDAHDFYPVVTPSLFYRRLEAWCAEKAAAVVTVSKGIAELIEREFGSQAMVVRNCQDVRLERTPAQGLREILRLPSDSFLLVAVGQVKPGQAAAEAVEAMASLPQRVHLAFLGKNTEMYQEMVKQYRLQSRVHLVPPVKQDEVVQFISSADAAIILYYPLSPNYVNCLPNGFFQSFSAGLPLLYPELPEIKRLAEHYGLGLPIDPKSPESIQGAVMSMLNDDNSLAKHKQNSLAARLALSWEQEEVILHDLVKEIIG